MVYNQTNKANVFVVSSSCLMVTPCNSPFHVTKHFKLLRQEKSTCQELKNKDKEVCTDPRLLFMCHQIRLTTKENQHARLSFCVASLKS